MNRLLGLLGVGGVGGILIAAYVLTGVLGYLLVIISSVVLTLAIWLPIHRWGDAMIERRGIEDQLCD